MLGASLANPIASKAAQIQHTMTIGGDGWQQSIIATLEQADPAERIAIERLLPMPALIEKLSAWEATRLGTLGPIPDGQELLNRKRVAYFKQVLDDYPPSYAQVFLIYALQAACLDEASQIVAELADARRLSKLRALPAVAQRLTSLGVDLSVFQEPSEPWTRVLRGAGRSLSRFAKDDRPSKYGSQKAELPAEYSEALSELELGDAIGMVSPGNVAMGGFDEVTFGVPHGVVDLGRSTAGGIRELAHGEYEQAGEQLAGAGVIVLTHLGIKAWNVVRGGAKAASTTAPEAGLRGPKRPGQFTLANFQGPITAEEAKLGAIFSLNADAQAALGRILSRIGRGGLEKVATLVNANSRAALFVAEHGEAGLYALLEAEGDVGAARAKLAAGGQTPRAPLALPAAVDTAEVATTHPGAEPPVAESPPKSSGDSGMAPAEHSAAHKAGPAKLEAKGLDKAIAQRFTLLDDAIIDNFAQLDKKTLDRFAQLDAPALTKFGSLPIVDLTKFRQVDLPGLQKFGGLAQGDLSRFASEFEAKGLKALSAMQVPDLTPPRTTAPLLDAEGGHTYGKHGPQTSPAQHKVRLETGTAPNGESGVPPDFSGRFNGEQLQVEAANLADAKLMGEALNAAGTKFKKEVSVDVNVPGAGFSYSLDGSGNLVSTPTNKVKAFYRLTPGPRGEHYVLITMYPIP
jgi:hypothetical protein